ncbi:MAG: DnaA family protein [bacterium]|jgi:DnaA family protein
MHPQMTLALDTAPATSFSSFHIDADTAVVRDTVQAFAQGALSDVQIYLWGDTGTGKSHLISAACQAVSHRGYRVAYVPGEMLNHRGALDGMEQVDLLCIDDLQRIDRASEVDLFHCINRCRELDTRLIIASDRAPGELGLRLKDLQTRLGWGLVFQMRYLSDDGLRDAFRQEIENRSLEASDEVLGYVFRRFPRRMSALKQLVDTLDEISLSEQRRITIPFIKTVFGEAERMALSEQAR